MADLVVAVATLPRRMLQPVDRALPRQRRAVLALRLQLVGEQRQHRITAKGVVVVDVLVAEGDRDDPLANQGGKRVDHLLGLPMIGEARRHPLDQPDRLASRSNTVPASDVTAPPSNAATTRRPSNPSNSSCPGIHSVCIGPRIGLWQPFVAKGSFSDSRGRCTPLDEISGLAIPLLRCLRGEAERVDAAGEFGREHLVHEALPLDAREAGEGGRDDLDAEVRFALGPGAGMAGVAVRLVDDREPGGASVSVSLRRMVSATVVIGRSGKVLTWRALS